MSNVGDLAQRFFGSSFAPPRARLSPVTLYFAYPKKPKKLFFFYSGGNRD
jgi:hypothetical protein